MIKKILLLSVVISQILTSCSNSEDLSNTQMQSLKEEDTSKFFACTTVESPKNTNITSKGQAIFKNNYWITGQTIKISFQAGSIELQNKVKEYANEWMSYANLKFEYVGINDDADVYIYFNAGSNYTFGKQINFGQLIIPNIPEETLKSIVLHEFGHLLGLQHEHQNPNANIQWNKPAVYDYYARLGWGRDQVDSQIFNALPPSYYTDYTGFDPSSIMGYSFPASFTTNGFSVPFISTLSITDKMFIAKMFPFPIKSNLFPGDRITSNNRITSPDGNYTVYIRSQKLILYSNTEFRDLGDISPNIKFSNATSSNVYLEVRGNVILLFKGSVSKTIGPNLPEIGNIDYITLNNSGIIDAIKNGVKIFSVNMKTHI